MAKLTVHRKGYSRKPYERKGYKRKSGVKVKPAKVGRTKVPPSTYKVTDRGAKGRGKKVFPQLKRGTLGISFKNSAKTRRAKESKLAHKYGEKKIVGKLRALQVLNKRTNPKVSKKAKADSSYIAGSFIGKKKVKYPTGFRRNMKRKR